jgi:hypothetical protein
MSELKSGDIVRLREPFKPSTPSEELQHNIENQASSGYEYWTGFMYGIVACTEDQGKVVFVYVFSATKDSIYLDTEGYPVRVQYSADEVKLERPAGDFGKLTTKL